MKSPKSKKARKNPPVRDGELITFQVPTGQKQKILDAAAEDFPTVPKKGQMSAWMRQAIEAYLSKQIAAKQEDGKQ